MPAKAYSSDGKFTDDALNAALEDATEWGENFRKPIDELILARFTDLRPEDVERLAKVAREAESRIYELGECELRGEITEWDIVTKAREEFVWLDAGNAGRLKNIAMYYARR